MELCILHLVDLLPNPEAQKHLKTNEILVIEFVYVLRNNISISRIMYSKMQTK